MMPLGLGMAPCWVAQAGSTTVGVGDRSLQSATWLCVPLVALVFLHIHAGIVHAAEPPAAALSELASEDFRTRESAQQKILEWARQSPGPAMDSLFRLSQESTEPEVRERCLSILRDVVIESEYLNQGEGYAGIRMQEELGQVPGDPKPRRLIRIIEVVAGSAAEKAGLRLNDLIAGLDGQIWHDEAASNAFTTKVRKLKPKTAIKLKILRDGKLMDVEVILGRRPPIPDNRFFDERQIDVDTLERMARDAHFRRWLDRKKSGDSGK